MRAIPILLILDPPCLSVFKRRWDETGAIKTAVRSFVRPLSFVLVVVSEAKVGTAREERPPARSVLRAPTATTENNGREGGHFLREGETQYSQESPNYATLITKVKTKIYTVLSSYFYVVSKISPGPFYAGLSS